MTHHTAAVLAGRARIADRAEWKLLATWCAELWPSDEYRAIVVEEWRQDRPPRTQDRR